MMVFFHDLSFPPFLLISLSGMLLKMSRSADVYSTGYQTLKRLQTKSYHLL
ncbi:hypothetical protein CIPAW_03G201200 [Carya illinoinensis]|uniref:Uncharacterized protein n=1 Tax=Carya illinoinensis TaxID=32201 RepID=A0A8T1R4U7_CARIL|nr:hypothetical protein CIPAW_03G201200 [Carya illinoinensis]